MFSPWVPLFWKSQQDAWCEPYFFVYFLSAFGHVNLYFVSYFGRNYIEDCVSELYLIFKSLGYFYTLLILYAINCWCKHNNNENNIKRNWIILLNFINLKREITLYYLDWGVELAFFKEIQALGWLNFVTSADCLWLVSPRIQ